MKIVSTGFYVPEHVVWNDDISDNDDWIVENIGIKQRRRIIPDQTTVSLGFVAALKAIKAFKIDMIIVATATPDNIAPSTACMIARRLNINCVAFDINAVCSGFLFAFALAENYDNVLIIGVDTFSTITDYKDRNCVFFGDGAGAVVVTKGDNMKSIVIHSDISEQGFICKTGGTFRMDGKIVYKMALKLVPEAINEALDKAGLKISDIDYMVPHQPSKRILNDIADKIGLPREKVLMNMDRYGNTSAATIPILLAESWSRFKKGDKILFAVIGSGWTYGAAVYEV
jgi:3-oxoacyl-[acyl-carrier-protein] synthase-3